VTHKTRAQGERRRRGATHCNGTGGGIGIRKRNGTNQKSFCVVCDWTALFLVGLVILVLFVCLSVLCLFFWLLCSVSFTRVLLFCFRSVSFCFHHRISD